MENASYALYIAIGVLIAIAVLSLVLFNWRKIAGYESAKDDIVAVKNKADFNKEYEAYVKSLMYGTDVLSCLNKAQNNNQQYVYSNYYGVDNPSVSKEDREEYFIDVEVTLKTPLYDDFKAYYKDEAGRYERCIGFGAYPESATNYGTTLFNPNPSAGKSQYYFNDPDVEYYYFKDGKVYQEINSYTDIMWENSYKTSTLYKILQDGLGNVPGESSLSGRVKTKVNAGTYNLLAQTESTTVPADRLESARLSALISTITLKKQTMLNIDPPTVHSAEDWWYCEWTTAANDFKTRKFVCTGTEYNEATGYITKISFREN